MNAVIYARYSSHNQTEQSIEGQVSVCRDYAERHGFKVVEIYADRAKSATTDERPEFQRMVSDSANGLFEAVIVYKIDRFSRDRLNSAIYKRALRNNGVRLLYAAESIPDTPEGIIMEGMLEALAEYYSAELGQKIKRGLRESAKKLKVIGGIVAYGYKRGADGCYEVVHDEAKVVRKIFDDYVSGKRTADIAAELNTLGLDREFVRRQITTIIKNPLYKGLYDHEGVTVEGGAPAIVSVEIWDEAQSVIAAHTHHPQKARQKHGVYALSGKLYCGKCGAGMSGFGGINKRGAYYCYYACHNARAKKTCDRHAVRREVIEKLIADETRKMLTAPGMIDYIAGQCVALHDKEFDRADEIAALKRELEEKKTAIARLLSAFESGDVRAVSERIRQLDAEKNDLEYEIAALEIKKPQITEEHIRFMLGRYMTDEQILETFLNCAYVFDEKLVLLYNLTDERDKEHLKRADLECLLTGSESQGWQCQT